MIWPPAMVTVRVAMAAHGMSVVELTRSKRGDVWTYVPGAPLNRRITMDTPFAVDGPAAGSDLLKTKDDPTGRVVRAHTLGALGHRRLRVLQAPDVRDDLEVVAVGGGRRHGYRRAGRRIGGEAGGTDLCRGRTKGRSRGS